MKSLWVAAGVALALFSGMVHAQDHLEKKKIEYLISSVEKLKEAAGHLRMKLQNDGGRVRTADDFIRLCASKSSISGKPYRIRTSDGKTMTSEQYFREKLKKYPSTAK
jgi:hypothetical protein